MEKGSYDRKIRIEKGYISQHCAFCGVEDIILGRENIFLAQNHRLLAELTEVWR